MISLESFHHHPYKKISTNILESTESLIYKWGGEETKGKFPSIQSVSQYNQNFYIARSEIEESGGKIKVIWKLPSRLTEKFLLNFSNYHRTL